MNDLISREEARNLMYHKQEPLTEYDLDSLPSVDAEPVRHGHWIVEKAGQYAQALCSNCGTRIKSSCGLHGIFLENLFCKICGAKMDEEVTDDN